MQNRYTKSHRFYTLTSNFQKKRKQSHSHLALKRIKYFGINEVVLACFLVLCGQHQDKKQLGRKGFILSYGVSPPSTTEEIRAGTQAGPRSRDCGGTLPACWLAYFLRLKAGWSNHPVSYWRGQEPSSSLVYEIGCNSNPSVVSNPGPSQSWKFGVLVLLSA